MKRCYEWRAGNPKLSCWVTDLRDELAQNRVQYKRNVPNNKTKCTDMQETDRYNHSIILVYEERTEGEELYTLPCNIRQKLNNMFWKFRGMRRGTGTGRYCLCTEEDSEIHVLLKCK